MISVRIVSPTINYIGSAASDWNDNSKNYHTIHAVTLDTKFLLENFGRNHKALQDKLAECLYSVQNSRQILR